MLAATVAVARAMTRSWRHESLRALGGSLFALRLVVGALCLVVAGWVAVVLSARGMVDAAPFEEAGRVSLLLTLSLTVVVAMAAVAVVALMVLVPDSEAFVTLLATMPLSRGARRLSLELPVLVSAAGVVLLGAGPFVWMAATATSAASGTALVLVAAALGGVGVLLGSASTRLLTALLVGTRMPVAVARSVATVVIVAVVGHQALGARADLEGGTAVRRVLTATASLIGSRPLLAVAVSVTVALLAGVLWWAAAHLALTRVSPHAVRLTGRRAGRSSATPRRLVVLELAQIARHPANVSTVTLVAILTALLVVSPAFREALLWPLGGALVVMIGAIVAIVGYGATWQGHWVYRAWTAEPTRWVVPKWIACGVFCASIAALTASVLLLTPDWDGGLVLSLVPALVIGFVAAMLAGLLVPVGEDQPLSSVAALLLAAGGSAALTAGLTAVLGESALMGVAAVVVAAAGLAAYRSLARWRERDLVH